MFALISLIKTLVLTLAVIVLLQIKIGDATLEQKTMHWFRTSSLTSPVQEVANGGARLVRDLINKGLNLVKLDLFEKVSSRPGSRDLNLRLKRSKQYVEEKARKAAQKIEAELETKEVSSDSLSY